MSAQRPYSPPHPGLQFLIFIALTIALVVVCALLSMGVIGLLYGFSTMWRVMQLDITPNETGALWIFQLVSTTLPIFLIPLVFARFVVRDTSDYLKAGIRFAPLLLLLVLLIMFCSLSIIEVLGNLNQRMQLPQALKGLEDWMRSSEKAAEKAQNLMLKMNNVFDLVKDLLLIGLLTAIAEEFMFRGVLQTIFTRWTRNHHAAIWITAALFSAFHMEFYGFLPRMALGVFFGYFVFWSGSIWTSVWAHFLNNGLAVVLTYLFQHKLIHINPDDQHIFNYTGYVFSMLITVLLLYSYRSVALATARMRNT